MTFSTLASPGVSLQGGGGSGGGGGGTPGGSNTQLQYNSSGAFAGAAGLTTDGTSLQIASASQLGWSTDLILTRRGTANLRLGAADAAAPVPQTLSVQSVVTGTTNTAGANLTITGSQGTGTGAGGSIIFQVAPAGSTGTAQNSLVTFFEAAPERAIYLYNTTDVTTNYERSRFQWTGNELRIGTQSAGTGTLRSVALYIGNTRYQIIGSNFNQFDQNIYMNVANIVTDTSTGFKIGTGTTQKIGFWNATPIAQPTTAVAAATVAATGAGDVVAASTTFDGYTIPQIVKALRNAGLLA